MTIFNLGGTVYAFDFTTIELCLAVFLWAKFRKKKGGQMEEKDAQKRVV